MDLDLQLVQLFMRPLAQLLRFVLTGRSGCVSADSQASFSFIDDFAF